MSWQRLPPAGGPDGDEALFVIRVLHVEELKVVDPGGEQRAGLGKAQACLRRFASSFLWSPLEIHGGSVRQRRTASMADLTLAVCRTLTNRLLLQWRTGLAVSEPASASNSRR